MLLVVNNSSLRIALLWHTFGHGNLGVDALARANAAIIEAAAARIGRRIEFTTLGSGQRPDIVDLPNSITIGPPPSIKYILSGRSRFFRELRRCDAAIDIGEGDSFTDIYGLRRYIQLCGTKVMSLFLRQPLFFAPQTIGPFDNPVLRIIAAQLVNRATAVYTRDGLSTEFLAKLGTRVQREEFIDVAFGLPYTPREKSRDVVRIGINVSGLLYFGGHTGNHQFELSLNYKEFTSLLVGYFLSQVKTEVYLFSHVEGDSGGDDDRSAVEDLGRRYLDARITPAFRSSIEAKSWISGLDFVVAGRMHACIGAYSAGVPVVPVAYSRKFNGLFGTLNYQYYIDGKMTSLAEAFAATTSWYANRGALELSIADSRPLIADRLRRYEDCLVEILGSLVSQNASSH